MIRGGYGVYFDWNAGGDSSLYFNPPYFSVRTYFPTQTSLLMLSNPFPSGGGVSCAPIAQHVEPRTSPADTCSSGT